MVANLHLNDLSFGFTNHLLFRNISLNLAPGEIVHLKGPNGAGKSTLISIIAGLRMPLKGKIELYDTNGQLCPDRRKHIALLPPENNGHYLKRDAVSNLLFWLSLRGQKPSEKELQAAMDHWGLGHALVRENLPVGLFSTGMKRRLAMARLILSKCRVWLLDEPLFGLDDRAVGDFRLALQEHCQAGGMAMIVSHDLTFFKDLPCRTLELSQFKGAQRA